MDPKIHEEIERECKDCGKIFKLIVLKSNKKPRFKRKYCDECKEAGRKSWENKELITIDDCEDE